MALHGFTGAGVDFAPLARALPEFAWVTPDLPGHAPDLASPGAPADKCSVAATMRYLERVVPRARGKPPILLGYSLGGRLALAWALAKPRRFAALILIGTTPGIADARARGERRAADGALAAQIMARGVPAFLRDWRRRPLIATQESLPGPWKKALRARRQHLRAEGLAASLRGSGQGVFRPLWSNLERLQIPTLLVAGAQDPGYLTLAKEMQAHCPHAEILRVPRAGHMAHLENLPAFAVGLREFLARYGLEGASEGSRRPARINC